eukprot:40954-Heterocapsa_arctica.AAC.1
MRAQAPFALMCPAVRAGIGAALSCPTGKTAGCHVLSAYHPSVLGFPLPLPLTLPLGVLGASSTPPGGPRS